jgi:hypothetical protein
VPGDPPTEVTTEYDPVLGGTARNPADVPPPPDLAPNAERVGAQPEATTTWSPTQGGNYGPFPGNASNTYAEIPGLPLSTYDRRGHEGETVRMIGNNPCLIGAAGVGAFGALGATAILDASIVMSPAVVTGATATAGVAASPAGRSLAQALQLGVVNAGGRLAQVLGGIEQGYRSISPTNALQGLRVVSDAAARMGLETGIGSSTIGGSIVLQNVGGIVTTISPNGTILVQRGSDVLLHLISGQ